MNAKWTTERNFDIHDRDTAPPHSKPALDWYAQNVKMIPNLAGVMAESPALIHSYLQAQRNIAQHGTLTPQETNVVQTTVADANRCQYCVALHTGFGKTEAFNNTDEQLAAVRSGRDFSEPQLNALRDFVLLVMKNAGRMGNSQFQRFIDAGYTRAQALEVVLNVAVKVMSNYVNQLALTPIDEAFAPLARGLDYQEERKALRRGA